MNAPFAHKLADTTPEPFDWTAHNAEQDRLAAELAKALDAWRETARTFMQFDRLGEGK